MGSIFFQFIMKKIKYCRRILPFFVLSTVVDRSMHCSSWFSWWPSSLRPLNKSEESLRDAAAISSQTTNWNFYSIISAKGSCRLLSSEEYYCRLSSRVAGSSSQSLMVSSGARDLGTILDALTAGQDFGWSYLGFWCIPAELVEDGGAQQAINGTNAVK